MAFNFIQLATKLRLHQFLILAITRWALDKVKYYLEEAAQTPFIALNCCLNMEQVKKVVITDAR